MTCFFSNNQISQKELSKKKEDTRAAKLSPTEKAPHEAEEQEAFLDCCGPGPQQPMTYGKVTVGT